MPRKILFLYIQAQPFLIAGIKILIETYNFEITLYSKISTFNATLDPPQSSNFTHYYYTNKPELSTLEQFELLNPDLIVCSGWIFKDYLNICRKFHKKGLKTILAFDNQWQANLKQRFLSLISPFILLNTFNYAWVPGNRQKQYALKLGFKEPQILNYLYATDTNLFEKAYHSLNRTQANKKRFLYVGRLEEHKLLNLLIAFTSLDEKYTENCEMVIIGDGTLKNHPLLLHKSIVYKPSMSQQSLLMEAQDATVFCLCSRIENWGMVIQEFAATGMPLLISTQCGASDHFGKGNAYICNGNNILSIQAGLKFFINTSTNRLQEMGRISNQLATQSNSHTWAKELINIL